MRSDFILLIAESVKRFGQKSPKYFRVVKYLNLAISFLAGIPLLLIQADVILPSKWSQGVLLVVTFCTAYGAAMNGLTVARPADLPFTEKKEIEQAIKANS